MVHVWERISYIVQLIGACLLFLAPVRKRPCYPLRAAVGAVVLVLCSYAVGGDSAVPQDHLKAAAYWAAFSMACVPYVVFCLKGSLLEGIYCTVCASATQHAAMVYRLLGGENPLVTGAIYAAVYVLFYWSFARKLPSDGSYPVSRGDLFPMLSILLFVWVLSFFESEAISLQGIIYHVSDALCCYYILWMQTSQKEKMRLQRELDGIQSVWRQQKKQYEITQETIEMVNRRCHDLKHQIRALRQLGNCQEREEYFDEIERGIVIYDTAVKTGNKALDIVLMEKGLFCQEHDIQWSCMADGSKLEFMKLEDIYAIFGNALDNAISAVLELKDACRRIISLKIITKDELMVIQVQNYHDRQLRFENGLPVTTHKEKNLHGFGMKSMLHTVEKYGGTITVNAQDGIFMLQILIPLQK